MTWAASAYRACVSWSGTSPRISEPLLVAIEARSTVTDGLRVATFTRKDLVRSPKHRSTLNWAQRAGVLMFSRNRGSLGAEYRLLDDAEVDAETSLCDRCAERHYKTALFPQDVLAAYVHAQRWDEEPPALAVCHLCHPYKSEGGCVGCGARETPCALNGRPVCAWCYLSCLRPEAVNEWLEGQEADIDLTALAVDLETRIGLANIPRPA